MRSRRSVSVLDDVEVAATCFVERTERKWVHSSRKSGLSMLAVFQYVSWVANSTTGMPRFRVFQGSIHTRTK